VSSDDAPGDWSVRAGDGVVAASGAAPVTLAL
jgi:alpha-D-xyloside xylohydrolase